MPEIFVSVLALGTADQFKVLFQGIQLRSDTLKSTLSLFGREFSLFENEIAAQRRDQSQQNVSSSSNAQQQSGSGSDLGAMIQMSMLALSLLPAGLRTSSSYLRFFPLHMHKTKQTKPKKREQENKPKLFFLLLPLFSRRLL